MIQRATQHSASNHLHGDDDDGDDTECDGGEVERIKQTTTVDLAQRVYIGEENYHATLGCVRGAAKAATIATAIERDVGPCSRCQPPDYRANDETAGEDEDTDEHADHSPKHGLLRYVRPRDITIPLPEQKPTTVEDIDPIVHAKSESGSRAHIAARGEDQPEPLCTVVGTYGGTGNWLISSQAAYPDPDKWFEICTRCLVAYDRVDGGRER